MGSKIYRELTLTSITDSMIKMDYSKCFEYCVKMNGSKGKFINDPANGVLWIKSGIEYTFKKYLFEYLKMEVNDAQLLFLKYKITELELAISDLPF